MMTRRLIPLVFLLTPLTALAQTPQPVRDPRALSLVAAALSKMGGTPPSDSTASGTVQVTAGSRVESGTINILTRGLNQTRDDITVPSGEQIFVYNDGYASDNLNGAALKHSGELGASAQSPLFPLQLLAWANGSSDVAFAFVGAETLNGAAVSHISFWNTYGGVPVRQDLVTFSQRDVWLDTASGLPVKISYTRHLAGGASPGVAIDVFLSDYRNVNGFLYPFQIKKSVNGTPWATITIQSVGFNTGLPATDFTVQ
jgi:hypothetical protein